MPPLPKLVNDIIIFYLQHCNRLKLFEEFKRRVFICVKPGCYDAVHFDNENSTFIVLDVTWKPPKYHIYKLFSHHDFSDAEIPKNYYYSDGSPCPEYTW